MKTWIKSIVLAALMLLVAMICVFLMLWAFRIGHTGALIGFAIVGIIAATAAVYFGISEDI